MSVRILLKQLFCRHQWYVPAAKKHLEVAELTSKVSIKQPAPEGFITIDLRGFGKCHMDICLTCGLIRRVPRSQSWPWEA